MSTLPERTVVIHAEDDSYWAEVREHPGCYASGRTLPELLEALGEAIEMYDDVSCGDPEAEAFYRETNDRG